MLDRERVDREATPSATESHTERANLRASNISEAT
jgi:hypothetical protein